MKIVPDVEIAAWLESLPPPLNGIEWDRGNERKNEKHAVAKTDIEHIIYGQNYVFVGKIISSLHTEWRGLILGVDRLGRGLSLIFTVRGSRLRPISCRPMRNNERKHYESQKATSAEERPDS